MLFEKFLLLSKSFQKVYAADASKYAGKCWSRYCVQTRKGTITLPKLSQGYNNCKFAPCLG